MHRFEQSADDWTSGLRRVAERVGLVAYLAYLMGCALNALFIGGAPIAMLVGYDVLGGMLRSQLLAVGVGGVAVEACVVLFTVVFWAVTTVPGFRVWDA